MLTSYMISTDFNHGNLMATVEQRLYPPPLHQYLRHISGRLQRLHMDYMLKKKPLDNTFDNTILLIARCRSACSNAKEDAAKYGALKSVYEDALEIIISHTYVVVYRPASAERLPART